MKITKVTTIDKKMMKKLLVILAFAGVSTVGMAQNENQEQKYSVETNSFWSNWFVQANLGYDVFYSNQEKGKGFSKSPFKSFRSNFAPTIAVGKWFTPGIGLRTKLGGVWGRTVNSEIASKNKMNYFQIQEQVLFNLSNLICGYQENRLWNAIPYAGVGLLRNYSDNENCHTGTIGLLNTFRLNSKWALNLDLSYCISDDDFDGEQKGHKNYLTSPANGDRFIAVEVGVTYNLGKNKFKKTRNYDDIIAMQESQINDLKAQLAAAAKAETASQSDVTLNQEPKTVVVEKVVEKVLPVQIFFDFNKAESTPEKGMLALKALVENSKDKSFKVTGYADSKTGKSNYNQKISEKRANYVVNEMVKMGVDRNKIEVAAGGGVETWAPESSNRCVVVEVK